jgi:Amt family ammonium transporter
VYNTPPLDAGIHTEATLLIWLLVFGVGAVLVRAGLALRTAAAVRPADVGDALLRSGAEAAAAVLAFWAIGAPLLFGRQANGFLAFDPTLIGSQAAESAATEFFHAVVATVGGAVVGGAIAGRARFHVSVVASAVLGGVVFPVVGHLLWFGYLRRINVVDFGGATAIHLTAGVFAAVAVAMVGSRPGRYGSGNAGAEPPALDRLPVAAVSVALLAVGWLPYVLGSLIAHPTEMDLMATPADAARALAWTAMNTALAAAGGLAGGLAYGRLRHGRAELPSTSLGLLGGLVAITAGCVAVGNLGALMIGLVAGGLVPAAAGVMDRRARLDDPVGAVAVHGVGAIWGMLAAAAFAADQSTIAHFQLLAVQSLALAVTLTVSAVAAGVTFGLLRGVGPLRAADR